MRFTVRGLIVFNLVIFSPPPTYSFVYLLNPGTPGESYEKLEQPAKAKKCYMRALNVGDQEDIAMIRLAKVCEKLHDEEGM